MLGILDWKEGRINNVRLLEVFSQGKVSPDGRLLRC